MPRPKGQKSAPGLPGSGTPGPGRPAGSKNKITMVRARVALDILRSGVTPLGILMDMATGHLDFDKDKFEAAKAAAPYVHPKLLAIDISGQVSVSHEAVLERLDELPDDPQLDPGNEIFPIGEAIMASALITPVSSGSSPSEATDEAVLEDLDASEDDE